MFADMMVQDGLQVVGVAAQLRRQHGSDRAGQPLQASRSSRARRNTRFTARARSTSSPLSCCSRRRRSWASSTSLAVRACRKVMPPAMGRPCSCRVCLTAPTAASGTGRNPLGTLRCWAISVLPAPGGLNLLEIPATIAGAADPAGLLGLADLGLAHAERLGELAIAGGPHGGIGSKSSTQLQHGSTFDWISRELKHSSFHETRGA